MLRKTKEQNIIGFLEKNVETENEQNNNTSKNGRRNNDALDFVTKSENLNCHDNGLKTSKNIMSAQSGKITDMGGPEKQIKIDISNSIWDSEKIAKASKSIDSQTATKLEKEKIKSQRKQAEDKLTNDLLDNLKSIDQRKGSSVSSLNVLSDNSNTKLLNNNISLFDDADFERVPAKTAGEILSEEVTKKRNEKDYSWKNNGKCITSQDITSSLFDKCFSGTEKKVE